MYGRTERRHALLVRLKKLSDGRPLLGAASWRRQWWRHDALIRIVLLDVRRRQRQMRYRGVVDFARSLVHIVLPQAADDFTPVVTRTVAVPYHAAVAKVPLPRLLVLGKVSRPREGLQEAEEGRRQSLVILRAFDDQVLGHDARREH